MKKGFVIAMGVVAPLVANAMQEESSFAKTLAMGSESVRVVPVVNESPTDGNDAEIKRKGKAQESSVQHPEEQEVIFIPGMRLGGESSNWSIGPIKISKSDRGQIEEVLNKIYPNASKELKGIERLCQRPVGVNWQEVVNNLINLRDSLTAGLIKMKRVDRQQMQSDPVWEKQKRFLDKLDFVVFTLACDNAQIGREVPYNPCRMFWSIKDIARELITCPQGEELSDDTLVATSVYLFILDEYVGGSKDPERYKLAYQSAMQWLVEDPKGMKNNNRIPKEHAVAWAIQRAKEDKETLKRVREYSPKPWF